MGERGYAFIKIGGTIPEAAVEDLCTAIEEDGVFLSYDGCDCGKAEEGFIKHGRFVPKSTNDLLAAVGIIPANTHGHLILSDFEARGGMFESIESRCIRHNIQFDRFSSAMGEWSAEWCHRRPDTGDISSQSDESQSYYVPQGVIYELKLLLEKGDCAGALNVINTKTFLRVTPLPPFKIEKACGTILEPGR